MSVDPLPPDVQAARKARINSDIIELCSKPTGVHTTPTARGIGLYTHVAGPKTANRNPHHHFADRDDGEVALLPLGGPRKAAPSKPREPPYKELAALYKELQDAVKAEEKIYDDLGAAAGARGDAENDAYRMSLDTLKKKYGDVNASVPESVHSENRRYSEISGTTNDEAPKRRKVSFAQLSEMRRESAASVPTATRDADPERRGSGSRMGNDYDVYRDPRRRRR